MLGKPSAGQRATCMRRVRGRTRRPWPQLAASRLKSLPLNASAARLMTWVTSDHMGHVGPRGSRRITWVTPNHGLRDAPQQVLPHGVSFVESLPPNSTAAPQTLPPRAPSSWVCSRAAAAAVSYIEEGGLKKKKGLCNRYLPPREECEITELTSSLAFRSLRSLSL